MENTERFANLDMDERRGRKRKKRKRKEEKTREIGRGKYMKRENKIHRSRLGFVGRSRTVEENELEREEKRKGLADEEKRVVHVGEGERREKKRKRKEDERKLIT